MPVCLIVICVIFIDLSCLLLLFMVFSVNLHVMLKTISIDLDALGEQVNIEKKLALLKYLYFWVSNRVIAVVL